MKSHPGAKSASRRQDDSAGKDVTARLSGYDEHKSSYRHTTPPYIGIIDRSASLVVNACGWQKPRSMEIGCARPSGLADCLLIYLHQGSGYFDIGGERQLITAGHTLIFRPHEAQVIHYLPELGSQTYWVHFTGQDDERLLDECQLNRPVIRTGSSDRIVGLFADMIQELDRKDDFFAWNCAARLAQITALLGRLSRRATPAGQPEHGIGQAVFLMETRYAEHWPIVNLARACCLSPNYFITLFRNQTGYTPIEYLNHIRIRKADELLAYTDLSIKAIARQVGYENPLYFSRRYTQSFGFPPSARRKLFQG